MNQSHGGEAVGAAVAIVWMVLFYGGMFVFMIGGTIIWVLALVDVVKRQFKDPQERLVWVLVICLAQMIGAIVYMVVGRKKGWLPGEAPPAGTYTYPPPPPVV